MEEKLTLAAARINAGLTQAQAAKATGVSTLTLRNWEKGKASIPAKALFKLADMYNWPVDHIKL